MTPAAVPSPPQNNHDVENGSSLPRPSRVQRRPSWNRNQVFPTTDATLPMMAAPMTPVREDPPPPLDAPGSASKDKDSNAECSIPSPPREPSILDRKFYSFLTWCSNCFFALWNYACTLVALLSCPFQATWTCLRTQGDSFMSMITQEKVLLLGETPDSASSCFFIYSHIACSYLGVWMLLAWLVTHPLANNVPNLDMSLQTWHIIVDAFFLFDCVCKRLVTNEPFCSFGCPTFQTLCSFLAILPFEALSFFGGTRKLKVWLNFLNLARFARLLGHGGFYNGLYGRNKPLRVIHCVLAIVLIGIFFAYWFACTHLGLALVSKCSWLQRGRLEREHWRVQLLWAVYSTIGYNSKAHAPSPFDDAHFRPDGGCNILDSSQWKHELWQYLLLDLFQGLFVLVFTVLAFKLVQYICFLVYRGHERKRQGDVAARQGGEGRPGGSQGGDVQEDVQGDKKRQSLLEEESSTRSLYDVVFATIDTMAAPV